MRAYLNALRPELLILAETEFWPNLLAGCRRRGIPVAVVNARISDRSWPRYRRLRGLWRPFLSDLKLVLAQSETDAERLRAIGCRAGAGHCGRKPKVRRARGAGGGGYAAIEGCARGARFLVAGSTLEGEESALLEVYQDLTISEPALVLVLAPRHPERFSAVASLVAAAGLPLVRRSAWKGMAADSLDPLTGGQVVLLDTIGELASVYSLAAVAFVGGSLVAGGRPQSAGAGAVRGAHRDGPALRQLPRRDGRSAGAAGAAHRQARGVARGALSICYTNGREARAMGQRARKVFEEQAGATARCVEAIMALVGRETREPRA